MGGVLALRRQDGPNLIDSFSICQWPMRPAMAGPANFRLLFFLRSRRRGSPASPSEEGGLEEFVEFCLHKASCRSESAICFSFAAIRSDCLASLLAQLLNFAAQALVLTEQRLGFRRWTPLGARSSKRGS